MKITLHSIDPFSPPLRFEVDCLPALVGCNGRSDVTISDRWVSERHCELLQQNDEIWVRVIRAKHGVLVNGKPVKKAVVRSGDSLTLGIRTLQIECVSSDEPAEEREFAEPSLRPVENAV